jgi:hypothetical protein
MSSCMTSSSSFPFWKLSAVSAGVNSVDCSRLNAGIKSPFLPLKSSSPHLHSPLHRLPIVPRGQRFCWPEICSTAAASCRFRRKQGSPPPPFGPLFFPLPVRISCAFSLIFLSGDSSVRNVCVSSEPRASPPKHRHRRMPHPSTPWLPSS